MNGFDYFLVIVVGFSALFSALRGWPRELWGLIGWLGALVGATLFSSRLAPELDHYLSHPAMAATAAFILTFLAVKVVWGLLGLMLRRLWGEDPSAMSRVLGMLFGLARGAVIVLVGFMVFLSFDIDPPQMVKNARLTPLCISGAQELGRLQAEGAGLLEQIEQSARKFTQ